MFARLYLIHLSPEILPFKAKHTMCSIKTGHHFICFSREAVVLLQSGPPREHRRALNTYCTANGQGAQEQECRMYFWKPNYLFSGVFSNVKKPTKPKKKQPNFFKVTAAMRDTLSPPSPRTLSATVRLQLALKYSACI